MYFGHLYFSPTEVNFENQGNLYTACLNPTSVVWVIVEVWSGDITQQSTLVVPISST